MAKSKKRAKSKKKSSSSSTRKPTQKNASMQVSAKTPKKVEAFDLNVKPLKAVKIEKKNGDKKKIKPKAENFKLPKINFSLPKIDFERFKRNTKTKEENKTSENKFGFHKFRKPERNAADEVEVNSDSSAFRRGLDNIPEMMFAIIAFFMIPIGLIFTLLFFKNHKLKFIYSLAGSVAGMGTIFLIYKATLKIMPLLQKLLN